MGKEVKRMSVDEFLVGAIYDAITDFWEVYDLGDKLGRECFAEEIASFLDEFYFKNKIVVKKEDLEKWYQKLGEIGDPIWEEIEKYLKDDKLNSSPGGKF